MRIVLDLQGAQTESRHRGIGRYSLSLALGIARNRGPHEVIIVLSGLFPDTIPPLRAAFLGILDPSHIRIWTAPAPVRDWEPENRARREAAELIREAFIANLNPDVVHVSSLFEGFVDDAVTTIGSFAGNIPTAVTLYDLIPYLRPEIYLEPNPIYAVNYLNKIKSFKRAKLWLGISESACQEGLRALNLLPENVVNISTSCDDIFQKRQISEPEKSAIWEKFGLSRPFILYSGGADGRKNLKRLIAAYAQLPAALRQSYHLVLASRMPQGEVNALKQTARSAGLDNNQSPIFTGYITDAELVTLNNLCTLFVFPSLHEGFGLPALEAMACGAPVIGSNASSIPEVIGRDDALFDPTSETSISHKIAEILENPALRADIAEHGFAKVGNFSWDISAKRAIAAFERLNASQPPLSMPAHRPTLAFVSPLPPERTGIADFSAELIPSLAKYYDITLIADQDKVAQQAIPGNYQIHNSKWLREHHHVFDRVCYHMGNSPFHQNIIELIEEVPGTLVLHDFFLSSLMNYLEHVSAPPHAFAAALYESHGYAAVQERYSNLSIDDVKLAYPANLRLIQHAQGVIVHSQYSRQLAANWYGENFAADWRMVPLLRKPAPLLDKQDSRKLVGIGRDDYVICSFGFLDATKLNRRLLDCWLSSAHADHPNCVLIFAGENDGGAYGEQLLAAIRDSGKKSRIRITGWTDLSTFRHYLAAADVAVQLRSLSRGETSAAVLDCMAFALPTIVNANGSFAELPKDAVWMLPDAFDDAQLIEALNTLWQNAAKRQQLGANARRIVSTRHAADACAAQYADAIEAFHAATQYSVPALIRAIAKITPAPSHHEAAALAQAIAQSLPIKTPTKKLLLDVSATCRSDLKTGIERVTRALLLAAIHSPPAGYRVEPVYLSDAGGAWHYRYARAYTLSLLGCPPDTLPDEAVDPQNGDIVLGLDLSGPTLVEASRAGLFRHIQMLGVKTSFVVYDLLPVTNPEFFPPGANSGHATWLSAVAELDSALCISKAVADDYVQWLRQHPERRNPALDISWFHLGADIGNSSPTHFMPPDAEQTLRELHLRPSFLMVGTIEPRKGHLQTITAFTQLWRQGLDVNLVIVGKEGWKGLPDADRRTIPEIIATLRSHPELHNRLLWLEGISDVYLEKIYAVSSALISPSEGEGFGLPLIEAAQHKIPLILRDIPVFREIVGEHASYFQGLDPEPLAGAIERWLIQNEAGTAPQSDELHWLTWQDSWAQLLSRLVPPSSGAHSSPAPLQAPAK